MRYESNESIKGNYKKLCKCGCGEEIWHFNKCHRITMYKHGHHGKFDRKVIECGCGCGEKITIVTNTKSLQYNRRFKSGHNSRMPEHHPNWKGGRIINSQGYVLIYNPNHPFANRDG